MLDDVSFSLVLFDVSVGVALRRRRSDDDDDDDEDAKASVEATFQPLICDSLASATSTVSGVSGIQMVNYKDNNLQLWRVPSFVSQTLSLYVFSPNRWHC